MYESYNSIRSSIDHFLFSNSLSNKLEKSQIIYDSDNKSDHNPIYIELKLDQNYDRVKQNKNNTNKVTYDWKDAKENKIIFYKIILNDILTSISLS